ncbi:hypothetical protein CC78DRAFT_580901 [Lojkania enalia]|uniref:Uncharacterized protein n=1 Tax=Lojkania enalia TaxID=147567 RepID=A0A9P4N880_9PLEO|nr:hypothetical protein CC78DRAFT_580901 [Didymosphaeria enalia]
MGSWIPPTLQNLESYQWIPDLNSYSIDPDADVLSTYHMLRLFSAHRISTVLIMESPIFGPAHYVGNHSNSLDSYIFKTTIYDSTASMSATVGFESISEGTEEH